MLKKIFYLFTMMSLLVFVTACDKEKEEDKKTDYTVTGDIQLGASGNATLKTAFDADTQTPISTANISATDQAKVDFVFLNDDATNSYFYAPSYVQSGTIPTWTVKNYTNFKTLTMTAAEYDAIGSAQAILDAYNAGTAVYTIGKSSVVAVGKYYGFSLSSGKKGIIKVTGFTATSSGSVTFQMKIQNEAPESQPTLINQF